MKCKGLVFRIRKSSYWSREKNVLHNKKTATLLVRESCAACHECEIARDQIVEFQSDNLINDFDDGDKVKYEIVNAKYGEGDFVLTI